MAGLLQLEKIMVAGNYAAKSLVVYAREVRFFAEYFPDVSPNDWNESHVLDYMVFLKKTLGASYSKHKMFAQSIAFFFRHVLKRPFDTPSKLYPRREFKLPCVLTQEEIKQLLEKDQSVEGYSFIEQME